MEYKLNYDDVVIVPEAMTTISSRKECNCFDNNLMLPIFTAPMDTVVDSDSAETYYHNKINPIIPRTESWSTRMEYLYSGIVFVAFSLSEAKDFLTQIELRKPEGELFRYKICIDMANGHMQDLIDVCRALKEKYSFIEIMTGNIAKPETYRLYEEAGIDYCRANIGTGSGCLTSSCTGVHYPPFSLLKEMYEIKKSINGKCKIIADGGIKNFRDIQKALIYADYVMIGGLFNKAIDSAAVATYGKQYWKIGNFRILRPLKTLLNYGRAIPQCEFENVIKGIKEGKIEAWKTFYGMSTKQAQKAIAGNDAKLKTAEGIVKKQKVEYSLAGWVENEKDYLRSAMSYTNSKTLEEYKESKWEIIPQIRYNN